MSDTPRSFRAAVCAGIASVKENALPGLILWITAVAIVVGYYLVEPVTAFLGGVGRVKARGGFLYSAVSTALFGGFIPFLWRRLRNPSSFPAPAWRSGLFLSLFWAWKGIEVDLFYRFQDILFGAGASAGVQASIIIQKVAFDQFVYNPLWAGWTQVLAYWWMENRFSRSSLADRDFWKSIPWRVVTVLISTWGVWIPMVSIIYAMPSVLQIPLFNIALCFWSLMLASLTREKKSR